MIKKYIDTNILIAYMAGPEKDKKQYPKAKKIFEEIKRGEFLGIISTLTVIEIIGVLRTQLGRDKTTLQRIDPRQQAIFVKEQADKIYTELIKQLLEIPYVKFEKGRQINFQGVMDDALDVMNEAIGVVKFSQNCGRCNQKSNNYNHKQILVADILHALLAMDTQCDYYLTFDEGFKGVKDVEKLYPLNMDIR